MSWLRLLTQKFEDIGVFTYWLQDERDSVSPPSCCSIIVQRNVKVYFLGFYHASEQPALNSYFIFTLQMEKTKTRETERETIVFRSEVITYLVLRPLRATWYIRPEVHSTYYPEFEY